MDALSERYLKTGGDPRNFADYSALEKALAPLMHATEPDINWFCAEKRCLSLLAENGAELQTLAWYTLVRVKLAGLCGLNEGLSILETLIHFQWHSLWPEPLPAREAILYQLDQHLCLLLANLAIQRRDLPQLNSARQRVARLEALIPTRGLKSRDLFSPLDAVLKAKIAALSIQPVRSCCRPSGLRWGATAGGKVRAEESQPRTEKRADNSQPRAMSWVYILSPEPVAEDSVASSARVKARYAFILGMIFMLIISTLTLWRWQMLCPTDPREAHLQCTASTMLPAAGQAEQPAAGLTEDTAAA